MVQVPPYCPTCGNVFASRLLSISGNVKGLTLSGNIETCPRCGSMANTADGVFDVVDDVLKVIQGSDLSRELTKQLSELLNQAHREKLPLEVIEEKAAAIDPRLAQVVHALPARGGLGAILLIILAMLNSCDFKIDAKVDLNLLYDQVVTSLEQSDEPDLRNPDDKTVVPKADTTKPPQRNDGPLMDQSALTPESRQVRRRIELLNRKRNRRIRLR